MGFTERQSRDESGKDGETIPAAAALVLGGASLPIRLELPEDTRRLLLQRGMAPPQPVEGFALIDTGRMTTVVDESVCLQLGAREVLPGGAVRSIAPEDALFFTLKVGFEADWTPPMLFRAMAAADLGFAPPGNRTLCIFGRDFLADKMMIYNGRRGRFELHK